jgi:hypothetical protein
VICYFNLYPTLKSHNRQTRDDLHPILLFLLLLLLIQFLILLLILILLPLAEIKCRRRSRSKMKIKKRMKSKRKSKSRIGAAAQIVKAAPFQPRGELNEKEAGVGRENARGREGKKP